MKTGLAIATTCLLIALPAMAQSRAPRAQEFVNKVAGQRYVRNPIEPVGTHGKTAGQGHQAVCAADGQGSSKDDGRTEEIG
jgi:hypothetical protein